MEHIPKVRHPFVAFCANLTARTDAQNTFADLAIVALKATKQPLDLLVPSDLPEPLNLFQPGPLQPVSPSMTMTPLSARPRNSSRNLQREREDYVAKDTAKSLFLRDAVSVPTMIYKISCPDCERTDFTRLQGFLNHCRLKHGREFTTHGECVLASAGLVPEEEQDFVVENGT